MSKKKLISQRWNEDLLDKVKEVSKKLNISSTDLTTQGVDLIMELIDHFELDSLDLQNIKEKILSSENVVIPEFIQTPEPGYILDRILQFLEQNSEKLISSTHIAKRLDLPQSTVRTYLRKLDVQNENIIIYPGRPNQIIYKIME